MAVSVIIPAYNEAARVAAVVREALAYASEVIVIDDGSTDDTAQVAVQAGARVVSQANAGYIGYRLSSHQARACPQAGIARSLYMWRLSA